MRIGQTSFVVFASRLLSSGFGFAATLVFARIVGAEVLGYYSLVLVVSKWLRVGGEVGIASAVTKRMSESDDKGAFFTAGLVLSAAFGGFCTLGVLLFQESVNAYIGSEVAHFIILFVIIGLPASLISSALQGDQLVHIAGLLTPIRVGSRSLIQTALVVAGFGLTGMLLGYAVGTVLVIFIGISYLSVGIYRPTKEHFVSLLDFAKYSWLGNLSSRSFTDMDFIVLGAFVSPTLVGVYQIAWNLTNFVSVFGTSIQQTTFPELSSADAEGDMKLFKSIITDSIANSGLIAIPSIVGALIIGERLLRIYGDEFTQGVAVLGLLIMAMLIYDYQSQLVTGLNALDHPELSFRVNATFTIINILLNVLLVYQFGWVGAAVATAISAAVGLLLSFRYLYGLLQFRIPLSEISMQIFAALLMGAVVFQGQILFNSSEISNNVCIVLSLVGVGAMTYFVTLFVISRRFRSIVRNNLPIQFRSVLKQ